MSFFFRTLENAHHFLFESQYNRNEYHLLVDSHDVQGAVAEEQFKSLNKILSIIDELLHRIDLYFEDDSEKICSHLFVKKQGLGLDVSFVELQHILNQLLLH